MEETVIGKAGGVFHGEVDDDSIAALDEAMTMLNRQSNAMHMLQAVSIVSVNKQVVSGMKYILVVQAGMSTCANSGNRHSLTNAASCPVANPVVHKIIMIDQRWANPRYTMMAHHMIEEATPIFQEPVGSEDSIGPFAPIMGGKTECTSSPAVLAAAAAGMDVINSKLMASGVAQQFYVTEVTSATKQVVAGLNYRITYNAGPLNCPDGHTITDRINEWLSTHSATLNGFGDPLDTGYTGGSPLFDEMTGASLDRDEYILKQNPHQPWNRVCVNKADIANYKMTVWDQPWRTPRYMMTESTHTISVSITDKAGYTMEEDEEDEDDARTKFVACFAGATLVAMLAVSYRHLLVYRNLLPVYESSQVAPVFTEVEPHIAQKDYAPVLNGDASKQI